MYPDNVKHYLQESAYLLEQALPVCAALMEVAQSWDKDGDGLIGETIFFFLSSLIN